jgi:hypothetical protein
MPQLTYPLDLTNAFPGLLADLSPRNDVLSRSSEEAASFPYGTAVVAGTDPDTQVLLPTVADALIGVVSHTQANEVGGDDENLADPNHTLNCLHVGRIYVQLESTSPAVIAGTTGVFVRTANPAAAPADEGLGRFRGDVDGGDALTLAGGRWITSGSAGDLVVLEIDADASIS